MRVCGQEGTVQDYTFEELTKFFAYNKEYGRKDKIITFEEFLRFIGCRDLTFAIELKDNGIAADALDLLDKYNMKQKLKHKIQRGSFRMILARKPRLTINNIGISYP